MGQKRTWRDQIAMSALPPKADIPRRRPNVRFGPNSDFLRRSNFAALFDHLVGTGKQCVGGMVKPGDDVMGISFGTRVTSQR
jgi:hypothetical protein